MIFSLTRPYLTLLLPWDWPWYITVSVAVLVVVVMLLGLAWQFTQDLPTGPGSLRR